MRIRHFRICGRENAPTNSPHHLCFAIFAPMGHLIGSARAWRRIQRGSQGHSVYPVVVQAAPMDEHTNERHKRGRAEARVFWVIDSAPTISTPIRGSFVRNCSIIVKIRFWELCKRGEVCQKSSNLAALENRRTSPPKSRDI